MLLDYARAPYVIEIGIRAPHLVCSDDGERTPALPHAVKLSYDNSTFVPTCC
jgi:hypothetical protein